MTTHLVIGASGQVGEYVVRALAAEGIPVVGTYHSRRVAGMQALDIGNIAEVRTLFDSVQPSVVYLPAARSNVDYCELHAEECARTNLLGAKNVTMAAREVGATLVFFSSDYVFDGFAGPYSEDDYPNPLCEYGRQKLLAEHHIALNLLDYTVIRTTVVYGWECQGKNFIARLRQVLGAGKHLQVPVDQVGSPTYAPNLAAAAVELAVTGRRGLYHVVGGDQANRYEFACEAARVFGLDAGLIVPVTTAELMQPARRPLLAGLRVSKAQSVLTTRLLGYREGLRTMAADTRSG